MSPRAACRLETLGFTEVYDYVPGKADWLAHNLPIEGQQAGAPTAGRLSRDDVVTFRLDERVGEVRERIAGSPYGFGLVTSAGGVLLGRLRGSALDCDPALRAEEVMEAGPSTVRPDTPAADLAKRLGERELRWAIVTDPDGRLIGVVRREDLERALPSRRLPLASKIAAATYDHESERLR
jgi:CBS domain-containing protein